MIDEKDRRFLAGLILWLAVFVVVCVTVGGGVGLAVRSFLWAAWG